MGKTAIVKPMNTSDIRPGQATIIDSHAHVFREYFAEERDQIIEAAFHAGVSQMVFPGVNEATIPELLELAKAHPNIYIAVGIHPHDAKDWTDNTRKLLTEAAANDKVVAIGECGLDFFYNLSEKEMQISVFAQQLELSVELDKPIIIHCRDAWEETLSLVEKHAHGKLRGVFHCFTGGPELLERIAKLNFYVSFSGIVTFPNAKQVQAAATQIDENRILVETDCPYLAPQKVRGKRNEPSYVWFVAEKLAQLRGTSTSHIAQVTSANARLLFSLP